MKGYWKVPFRMVYCDRFMDCITETLYCHVWLRIRAPKFPRID